MPSSHKRLTTAQIQVNKNAGQEKPRLTASNPLSGCFRTSKVRCIRHRNSIRFYCPTGTKVFRWLFPTLQVSAVRWEVLRERLRQRAWRELQVFSDRRIRPERTQTLCLERALAARPAAQGFCPSRVFL